MTNTDRFTLLADDLKKLPTVLDPEQVADVIGVSRRTVDDLIKKGVIKAFALDPTRERKQYRINKADLLVYITTTSSEQN